MPRKKSQEFILSVGGSLIVTEEGIDVKFLQRFRQFILTQVSKGKKFYLVIGGGKTARTYINAALAVAPVTADDRDWVGIEATRLNAQLMKVIFGKQAYSHIVTNPNEVIKSQKPIVLASGYIPGCSTDHDAVLLAKSNDIKTVINLSNIDFAYDKDPRLYPEAKKLTKISWSYFRSIVGNKWKPGLNVPFDPVASREASELGLKVVILNGRKLSNLEKCLEDKNFKGTVIE